MSAPSRRSRESEYIKYGMLAVRSLEAINKPLDDKEITPEEEGVLNKASDFLNEIANGADLVSTGHYQGHNSTASMKALDFAMGPLEHLRDAVEDKEVASFFRQMADAIQAVSRNQLTDENRESLKNAAMFFQVLNDSLLESISSGKPRVGRVKERTNRQRAFI